MGNAKQITCYSTEMALSLGKKQQLPERDQVTSLKAMINLLSRAIAGNCGGSGKSTLLKLLS